MGGINMYKPSKIRGGLWHCLNSHYPPIKQSDHLSIAPNSLIRQDLTSQQLMTTTVDAQILNTPRNHDLEENYIQLGPYKEYLLPEN